MTKAGRGAEPRAEAEGLISLSKKLYVPPYNVAMIYNGLEETDKAIAWLERGLAERDPRMIFLTVEPKWNNLRGDKRFIALMTRIGFE